MTRVEPSTGTCPQCGQPIIDAEQYGGHTIRLNAKPQADGEYRAHFSTRGYWTAIRVAAPYPDDVFRGMRRQPHACPSYQLDLSSEAQPGPTTANKQESP